MMLPLRHHHPCYRVYPKNEIEPFKIKDRYAGVRECLFTVYLEMSTVFDN